MFLNYKCLFLRCSVNSNCNEKIFALVSVILAVGLGMSAIGRDFNAKLKRFVTISGGKYAPEISCDEAVKLGFTVNDYNRFVEYVGQLNIKTAPALTRPENLFLCSFIEYDGDKVVLAIPLEKALRAGATVQGYFQTLENLGAINEILAANEKKEKSGFIRETHLKMLEYAKQNPDSSAVKKFFTVPPMPQ